jgi:hypothetical protein
MSFKDILNTIKKSWNWIWKSDSIWSWLVALVLIFVFIKFIFFPGFSFIQGTSLPLAGVESSSMDHSSLKYCMPGEYDKRGDCLQYSTDYEICGKKFNSQMYFNLDKYWETCGSWYENIGVTKSEFSKFTLKNGFSRGDIIIVWGRFTPKVGDIIIFKPNPGATNPTPIIHRIIKIDSGIMQTKGEHNPEQLVPGNNLYGIDETNINKNQILGKAVFKVPYLGYVKIWASELTNKIIG